MGIQSQRWKKLGSPSAKRPENAREETTKKMKIVKTTNMRIWCRRWNILSLNRCLRSRRYLIVASHIIKWDTEDLFIKAHTTQRVHDPEEETTESKCQRHNEHKKDQGRSWLKGKLNNPNGVQDWRNISIQSPSLLDSHSLPKRKWVPAKIWHFSIVRPKDSLTTLNPMATTSSMKNDMEALPASRIETSGTSQSDEGTIESFTNRR